MSKTIYFIGAGASYGKRDDKGNVIEGIPIVSEIAKEFAAFLHKSMNFGSHRGDVTYDCNEREFIPD